MYKLLFILICCGYSVAAQQSYSTANVHSHNDYEQQEPFRKAYQRQFGSMEADIFWQNDQEPLWVAHTAGELATTKRTLDSLYLHPLAACIRTNKGYVYADTTKKLQLLIDIKTAAIPTLNKLIKTLQQYPDIIHCRTLRIVISGGRPDPSAFISYPAYIWFDGNIGVTYNKTSLEKIAMMSADWKQYTSWNGEGTIPAGTKDTLRSLITNMHALHKPVRFWGSPDNSNAWNTMMQLQVDYINTDHIDPLADFLQRPATR